MALVIRLEVTQADVDYTRLREIQLLEVKRRGVDDRRDVVAPPAPDDVSTYRVRTLEGHMIRLETTVEHRYGDGAERLAILALEAALDTQTRTLTAANEAFHAGEKI